MKVRSLTLTAGLIAALPALSLAAGKTVVSVRAHALELLQDLRTEAADTSAQAAELDGLKQLDGASWQTYAAMLESMKDDINTMGKTIGALNKLRDSMTPEERAALDRAVPLVSEMAQTTNGAIRGLAANQNYPSRPDYNRQFTTLSGQSDRLSHSLDQSVELARLRSKERRVEHSMGGEAAGF